MSSAGEGRPRRRLLRPKLGYCRRMPAIKLLLPDQNEELRALEPALAAMSDIESACRFLVPRVAAILDAPGVLLVQKRAGQWRVVAAVRTTVPTDRIVQGARRALATLSDATRPVAIVLLADDPWTCLLLHRSAANVLMLMVSGDWALSRALLEDLAVRFGRALDALPSARQSPAGRQFVAAYTLPRRLARAAESADRYQIIMEACAKAVGARTGSIAIYDRAHDWLSVVATYGYPAVLVRRVRIRPGEGVIGAVFLKGRPIRVDDIQKVGGGPEPRLRYRTKSFMSVPLVLRRDVIGVISVADPDEGAFSRIALRNLRALAQIACLAVDRANAVEEAGAYARIAAVDPLTGLFNRRYFISRLHEEVERARRQSSALAILMIDVDNFKRLNDQLGHSVGDAVLRVTGEVLRRSVRSFDVCARFGGDEFAILMPGSGPESARQIGERIRSGVADSRPSDGSWVDDLRMTASIGLATFSGTTADDLMERADQALYIAKRAGKNRVHHHHDTIQGKA